MNTITICYSIHRLETLRLTGKVMAEHDVIVLEEPFHVDFAQVLCDNTDIEEHLLELDVAYPEFTVDQYRLLQQFSRAGKQVVQVEPYLEQLLRIQHFFADGHSPDEIEHKSVEESVYRAERNATGLLINYYKEVRGDNFEQILSSMNDFARADAARFVLRDTLRTERILNLLEHGKNTYIEAGSMHLLLYHLLVKKLSQEWRLDLYSVDQEAVKFLNNKGNLFSPGDILTLHYIWGRKMSRRKWQRKCAQSLIYSKIVQNEERVDVGSEFPHTLNELKSIAAVKELTTENCRILFQRTRSLPATEAAEVVQDFVQKSR